MKKRHILPFCLLLVALSCAAGIWTVLRPKHQTAPKPVEDIEFIQNSSNTKSINIDGMVIDSESAK